MKRGDATSCSKGLGREDCPPHHRVAMMDSQLLTPHFDRWETPYIKMSKIIREFKVAVVYWKRNFSLSDLKCESSFKQRIAVIEEIDLT